MNCKEVLSVLRKEYNPKNVRGMAHFGIHVDNALGISMPFLRNLAKKIGKDHNLSQELWKTGIHEARILASMVDEPEQLTQKQMNAWVKDFNSWDICDQVCMNLFSKSKYAVKKIYDWQNRKEEFVKRTSFTLIACVAWHDETLKDSEFIKFFALIKKVANDERNFVKKAVNWALRNIGKRNMALNKEAVKFANTLLKLDSKSAHWKAKDAIRELSSPQVLNRLAKKDI
jgi:3-methyladenine DNA glycosylase AlkD